MSNYFTRTGDVRIGEFELIGVKCKDRTCAKRLTCRLNCWRTSVDFMPMMHPVMTRDCETPLAVYAVCESFEKEEPGGEEEGEAQTQEEAGAGVEAQDPAEDRGDQGSTA